MMVVYDEVSSSNTILQRGVYNDESLNSGHFCLNVGR